VRLSQGEVHLHLTEAEAERLSSAIEVGYQALSRAEYYIRTGLAASTSDLLVSSLRRLIDESYGQVSIPLDEGDEASENPRRPRPGR